MRERQQLEASLGAFDRIARDLDDNIALVALGEEEGDASIVAEAETALAKLRQEAHTREVEALLSGEADANDAYVEIHAGAGGTESQDWAQMLDAHVCALGRRRTTTRSRSSASITAKRRASSPAPC